MFIDTLVNISIQDAVAAVSAETTSVPLLIADTNPGWTNSDVVRAYGSLDELAADGFPTSSATYQFASILLLANPQPPYFLVGKKAAAALTSDDLSAIAGQNNTFFAAILVNSTDAESRTLADWTEGLDKFAFLASADPTNGTSDDGSLAAYVKDKGYLKSLVIFSPNNTELGIAAAAAGAIVPAVPGSINPAYRTFPGIKADTLTDAQCLATVGNLSQAQPGNRANIYISEYSQGRFLAGTTGASTAYEQFGIAWMKFNMRAAVFSVLSGQKQALTDKGVQAFIAVVRGVLLKAVANGLVDPAPGKDDDGNALPGISVTAPPVSSLTAAQRQAGVCPPISFTCTLAGPINAVVIRGTLRN